MEILNDQNISQLLGLVTFLFQRVPVSILKSTNGHTSPEIGNSNEPSKLFCTHCLSSLMDCAFCMIICIYLL